MASCKSCGAAIVWMKTSSGKNIPVDADSIKDHTLTIFDPRVMVAHFTTCPDSSRWRKRG